MNQLLTGIVLIVVGTLIVSPFVPWWGFVVVAFLVGLGLGKTGMQSFYTGFIAIAVVWLVNMIVRNMINDGILLGKIAELFPTPNGFVLMILTAILGGIVGGLAAATGGTGRQIFIKQKRSRAYYYKNR